MPQTRSVRNWKEYNKSLVKRGAIIFTFDENYFGTLYYDDAQKRGGVRRYSNFMYEYLLTIKVMLRLPWRATIGFATELLRRAFYNEDVIVPDYAHSSREVSKLDLKIKQFIPERVSTGMELAFDSTGVNIYNASGWHQSKYGKDNKCQKREQWKIHIAIDLSNMQIMSVVCTSSNVNDCEVVQEMCEGISGSVSSVRGDGAYDTEVFRKLIHDWGAKAIIPPSRTSKAQDELKKRPKVKKDCLLERDESIKMIRGFDNFDEGLKHWKLESGYHRRSLVESCMCRFKRIFGFYLQQKTDSGRRNEVIAKVNLLNLMASLGRAEYSS